MDQSSSGDGSSSSTAWAIPFILWNQPTVHYSGHNSLPICACPESDKSSPSYFPKIYFTFLQVFPSKPCMYFSSPPCVPHAPYILFFSHHTTVCEDYKSCSPLLYISLQSAETSILLGPNIFPSTLFWNILSPCFSLNTFTAIVDLSRFNNSCLKSPASTLVDLTFQSRALRSFSLNQLRNLSL